MAKPIALQPIAADDFAAFIRARCAETGQGIGDGAIGRILAITGEHPHDTQELGYFTWALAQGERLTMIEAADVDRALLQVLDAESAHYLAVWDELSAQQRLVLAALAAEPGAIYSEVYRQQHRLGSASVVQKSVSRLVARELIEQAPDGYRITDVFMRAWIRERAIP